MSGTPWHENSKSIRLNTITEAPYHVQIWSVYSPPLPVRIGFVRFSSSLRLNLQGVHTHLGIHSQTNLRVLYVLLPLDVTFYKHKRKIFPEVLLTCKEREGRIGESFLPRLSRLRGALVASFWTKIEKEYLRFWQNVFFINYFSLLIWEKFLNTHFVFLEEPKIKRDDWQLLLISAHAHLPAGVRSPNRIICGSIANLSYLTEILQEKKKRTFCHGNQRNFRANVSCWKAFFLMSWLTGRKFIQPCREWGKKGKAVLLSFISDTEVFRMRWLKTAQSGTAEVQYLVSFCLFQWAYISNVGTRRQKARFVLQCSFRQMFEEGISEAPLQFLKSYV